MQLQDTFVGLMAGAVGGYFVLGALLDAPWLMELAKARHLTESLGRTSARCVLAALGLVVIIMGCLIASGWRIHWS